jgi:uncharacterized peroxidase-related enzyme
MPYIQTTDPGDADGKVRAMYERQQAKFGYVPNYARAFCHRPELMKLWADLLAGIRRRVEPRRFELATLAAAHALRNSYCSLAHGKALTEFLPGDAVRAVGKGELAGTLAPAEAAIVRYARKVAADASTVTEDDVAALRAHGLSDAEIFDVAATAAARAFFAKLLDALGVEADPVFRELDEPLQEALLVGRPIAAG